MTVEQLYSLLEWIPLDDELVPNALGNLAIYRQGRYVGFVNCRAEHLTVVWQEAE